jgi:HPt (histidine-containing phosphotransfer) domain-containing protein
MAKSSPAPEQGIAAAMEMPAIEPGRPVDMGHLGRQTLGDWSLAIEVLRLYEEMQRTYFDRLETSTNRNDLMVNLHSLKAAADGVGAFALAQLARTAEDELKAGEPVDPERIADIELAVEEVSTFIEHLLENEPLDETG